MDQSGNIAVPALYPYVSPFANGFGLLFAEEDGLICINSEGKEVYRAPSVVTYSNYAGGLLTCYFNDKAGFLDINGRFQIPAKYDDALSFSREVAPACALGLWGVINTAGDWVINPKYESIREWAQGDFSSAQLENGNWIIIDRFGNEYTDKIYDLVQPENEAKIVTRTGSTISVLNNRLETKWTMDLDDTDDCFNRKTLPASKDGKWGILNEEGNWELTPRYTNLSAIHAKRRRFFVGGTRALDYSLVDCRIGFLNELNEIVIPADFARADDFNGELARVWPILLNHQANHPDHDVWYYIDINGNVVWRRPN